jgi:hypothetical protein
MEALSSQYAGSVFSVTSYSGAARVGTEVRPGSITAPIRPSKYCWNSINQYILLLNYIIRLCPINPWFYGAQTNTSPLKTTAYIIYTLLRFLLLILFNTLPRHSPTSLGVGGLSPP